MTPLITREFAIAFGDNDLRQMAHLFRRYIPMLYAIAAFFACFIAIQADKITLILGGDQFQEATLAVMIMAFYPIHQTYGQLSGSVFYATGQTGLYRNIGITGMLMGLPITFFLIAPTNMMGLDAGATGLAIKTVLLQFIFVNVQLYYNSKLLNLLFWRYLGHQIVCVGCLLLMASVGTIVVEQILGLGSKSMIGFILAGALYTALTMILVNFLPVIFGIKRQDIDLMKNTIRSLIVK